MGAVDEDRRDSGTGAYSIKMSVVEKVVVRVVECGTAHVPCGTGGALGGCCVWV
jgi:hypothetical protein